MNDAKQLINNELLNTIKELNEINNTSIRSTRITSGTKRSKARDIYKKQKKEVN